MATLLSLPMMLCGCNGNNKGKQETPVVYFTKDISPEALVKLYEALGVEAQGKVAVKISHRRVREVQSSEARVYRTARA